METINVAPIKPAIATDQLEQIDIRAGTIKPGDRFYQAVHGH